MSPRDNLRRFSEMFKRISPSENGAMPHHLTENRRPGRQATTIQETSVMQKVTLSAGTIRYRDEGTGPTLLFIHGVFMNHLAWRKVVPSLVAEFRCITPDWPLGSHTIPMADDADLSPRGVARIIREFIETLELNDVIVVGNDTGGALSQLLISESHERIAGLVLSSCNSFDRFVPPLFKPFRRFAELPGAIAFAVQPLRIRSFRRLPFVFGRIAKYPIPDEITDSWLEPILSDSRIRENGRRFVRGIDYQDLPTAAERLREFARPVLLLWAREDRLFPFAFAERWMTVFPNARLVPVTDSYTYVAEDQPQFVSNQIAMFAREVRGLSGAEQQSLP